MKTKTAAASVAVGRMDLAARVATTPQSHKIKYLLYLDPVQVAEIDQVWHRKQLKSRSETIRMLLAAGLYAEGDE